MTLKPGVWSAPLPSGQWSVRQRHDPVHLHFLRRFVDPAGHSNSEKDASIAVGLRPLYSS